MVVVVTAAEVAAAVSMGFRRSIGGHAPRSRRASDGKGGGGARVRTIR